MHLDFLYLPVSWVLLGWHQLFGAIGLAPDSGGTWALSIVFLVVTARLLLFRLFLTQVHHQRNLQKLQPELKQLRHTYANDRAELNRQIMKLQQKDGVNPLAGCLPMLLQIPVFLGLYHVLRHLANSAVRCTANQPDPSGLLHLYTFTRSQTCSAAQAKLFGAPLAASFHDTAHQVLTLGGDLSTTRLVILPLLVISAAATFATALIARAHPTAEAEGTAARLQRAMLYLIPLGVIASGLLFPFPLGVLLYWLASNLWTLAQQAYVVRFRPPADDADAPAGRGDPPSRPGGGAPGPSSSRHHVPQVGRRPSRPAGGRQRNRAKKR
jgi:YidC/Oxa1 family membrane protein insertase